jgi:hypothetical protein
LTVSLPSRSLTAILALALSLATLVVVLVCSPQALARTRKAACSSTHTVRPKGHSRACAQSRHASRSARRSKAHAHGKVKGHHARHAAKKKAKKGAKSQVKQVPAVCEDASAPARESEGFFTCADESEPVCRNGSIPVLSSNGSTLVCAVKPSGAVLDEAACEDGSAPVREAGGSFSCDDESQPVCENGATPTPSSNGSTLVCAGESNENSSLAEAVCEDGSIAIQASDGSFSCGGEADPNCEGAPPPNLSSGHWTVLCNVAGNESS